MTEPEDLLDQAAVALSAREEPDWRPVADRAKARVAGITNRFAPIEAHGATGPFVVSDRVLALLIRREVAAVPGVSADAVTIGGADQGPIRVAVDLVVAYGVVLADIAREVRVRIAGVLHRDLGVGSDGIGTVDVRFTDVDPDAGIPSTAS